MIPSDGSGGDPFGVQPAVASLVAPATRRELRQQRELAQAAVLAALPAPAPGTMIADNLLMPPGTPRPAPLPRAALAPTLALAPAPVRAHQLALPPADVSRRGARAASAPSRRLLPTRIPALRRLSSRAPGELRRSIAKRLMPTTALLFAGALLVGTTVPANAFIDPEAVAANELAATAASVTADPGQSIDVSRDVVEAPTDRGAFTVSSYADILRTKYGNRSYDYRVGSGAVRWPFLSEVPISDGFGERVAPCEGCSTDHKGVDFVPGAGAPIFAVASGKVVFAGAADNSFGYQVELEHVIAGRKVTSFYAHMQDASSPLKAGDTIRVGDFVGLVGATGSAVGAHLHLEIRLDGVQVDPYAWLKRHAN